MTEAAEFTLDDGTKVAVIALEPDGTYPVGAGDTLREARKSLRESLRPVTTAAMEVMDELRGMARKPEEVEIKFGVRLDGKLGGLLTSASAGAHLDIILRWTDRHPDDPSDDSREPDDRPW